MYEHERKELAGATEKVFPNFLDEIRTWKRKWGEQGLGRIRTVMMHRPGPEAMPEEARKDPAMLQILGLPEGPLDLEKMQGEHDQLVDVIKGEGIEILWLNPQPPLVGLYGYPFRDLCYCESARLINGGYIVQRYGSPLSFGKGGIFVKWFAELGIPILLQVIGKGIYESANLIWLDNKSCILATSSQTNMDGINQVIPVLRRVGVEEIHIAHLPTAIAGLAGAREWQVGDGAGTFHLDMVFGMANYNLAVVYPGLIDYETIRYLESKEIKLIECTTEELHLCAPNILALEPGKVIIPAHCNHTARELRKEGVEVIEVEMAEFAKGGGGPHCTVGTLVRDGSQPNTHE